MSVRINLLPENNSITSTNQLIINTEINKLIAMKIYAICMIMYIVNSRVESFLCFLVFSKCRK